MWTYCSDLGAEAIRIDRIRPHLISIFISPSFINNKISQLHIIGYRPITALPTPKIIIIKLKLLSKQFGNLMLLLVDMVVHFFHVHGGVLGIAFHGGAVYELH